MIVLTLMMILMHSGYCFNDDIDDFDADVDKSPDFHHEYSYDFDKDGDDFHYGTNNFDTNFDDVHVYNDSSALSSSTS